MQESSGASKQAATDACIRDLFVRRLAGAQQQKLGARQSL